MKKAFTLIELIFVIVIMGLLASVAIPKFLNLTKHSKESAFKAVVTSVQNAIENVHSQWIVNDNFSWNPAADGNDHSSDFNNSNGYPTKIDDGSGASKLFSYVLKTPVLSCGSKTSGCFEEYDDKKYEYNYTSSKAIRFEYNSSNGNIECDDGVGVTKTECENLLFK